jgi:CBS domain-containing protein
MPFNSSGRPLVYGGSLRRGCQSEVGAEDGCCRSSEAAATYIRATLLLLPQNQQYGSLYEGYGPRYASSSTGVHLDRRLTERTQLDAQACGQLQRGRPEIAHWGKRNAPDLGTVQGRSIASWAKPSSRARALRRWWCRVASLTRCLSLHGCADDNRVLAVQIMSVVRRLRQLLPGEAGRQQLRYVVISLLSLAAGVCAVWFVQNVLEVEGEAILIALLLLPLVVYLTLTGQVRELGAGSLIVKLNEVSREAVKESSVITAENVLESDPQRPDPKADPNRPRVATLTQGGGPRGHYDRERVADWLSGIARTSHVPLLIVRDKRGQVLAYMTFRSALDLLGYPGRGDEFIGLVNTGDHDAFDDGGGFSAVKTETLRENDTNAEALARMEETGLDALVVVDDKLRFRGIVERDRLLSRMILALVSTSR